MELLLRGAYFDRVLDSNSDSPVVNFYIITNTTLISVDNGVDAETVHVNTYLLH